MANFYHLLSVEPTATRDEIKRAFRLQIARYHPDKVQHLGQELQALAAQHAAALTEAYRTLMNAELRAEYDRLHAGHAPAPPPPRAEAPPPRFASERRDRDDFVRKATLDRFRRVVEAELGSIEEQPSRGFDLDLASKSTKLFSRQGGQRFAAKIVPCVDAAAVEEAWSCALRGAAPICVFLMGNRVAPAKELGGVLNDLRRRARRDTAISIVPIDLRDWTAHVPADAPATCRSLLKRLRDASSV